MLSQQRQAEEDIDQSENLENPEPSKSQRKREADEVRDFARLLTTLSSRKLKKLSLPPEIVDAINSCPPASTRGAHKRHLMFISKLMRKTEQVDEWRAQLDNPQVRATKSPASRHEVMRDNLIEAFSDHVDTLREQYPQANMQKIRQLIRQINATVELPDEAGDDERKEAQALSNKAKKASTTLLQLLRDSAGSNPQ